MSDGSKLPGVLLPPITELTMDGVGGSYYETQFNIPVYFTDSDTVYNATSWSGLDEWYTSGVNSAICLSIGFGLCAITLINVIALTPDQKRRLPLFYFLTSGLISESIRLIANIAIENHGPSKTAYGFLTNDYAAITVSTWYKACTALGHVGAIFSFSCTTLCFYLHCKGLMALIKLSKPRLYWCIMIYLLTVSLIALVARMGYGMVDTIGTLDYTATWTIQDEENILVRQVNVLNLVVMYAYLVSIGSWSAVFIAQAFNILRCRRRVLLSQKNAFDSALNVITIVGIDSLFLPVIFCILQTIPNKYVAEPQALIIPSVLCILPISSLFMSVNRGITSAAQLQNHPERLYDSNIPLRPVVVSPPGYTPSPLPASAARLTRQPAADPFADSPSPAPCRRSGASWPESTETLRGHARTTTQEEWHETLRDLAK